MSNEVLNNLRVKHESGVALIQVLLVTMILMLLAIYISKTAAWQVSSATDTQDKVAAYLKVRSVRSQIAFQLATEADQSASKVKDFNFHGDVFEFEGARVEAQDLNGLISLPSQSSIGPLAKLFEFYGTNTSVAEDIARQIIQYSRPTQQNTQQVMARPILYSEELEKIVPEQAELIKKAARDLTFQVTPTINPITATEGVLAALTTPEVAAELIAARANSSLTESQIKSMAGLYAGESLAYSIGPGYRVRVTAEEGDAFYREEVIFWINAYDERNPIQLLEQRPDY